MIVAIDADEGGREDDSDDHARQHEFHDVEQDHAEHAASRGAQRDAHRKLARTCRDHQSDDAVDSKRRERQDDAACDTRDGRLRQEVVHAVLPEPHSRDHLGIRRRSIFSRSETAVLRIEIARGVFKRRGHFLWRFARHAARNQEQLLRRLLRKRQQQLLARRAHLRGGEITADAHDSERLRGLFIVAEDQALANRLGRLQHSERVVRRASSK